MSNDVNVTISTLGFIGRYGRKPTDDVLEWSFSAEAFTATGRCFLGWFDYHSDYDEAVLAATDEYRTRLIKEQGDVDALVKITIEN